MALGRTRRGGIVASKELLTSSSLLVHFNPELKLVLACEASTKSLNDLSPGLSGATRLCSNLYVVGPITERNTDCFCSLVVIELALRNESVAPRS